jgi:hypothetical protein
MGVWGPVRCTRPPPGFRDQLMRLQEIPPDLRATLSLLLGQHKSYAEIAAMLSIEERAVHDRAHAALALLAPRQARELSVAQREQVGEYLLGQANHAQQSATLAYLGSSAAAGTWAQALAAELSPLASALPAIPTVGSTTEEGPVAHGAVSAADPPPALAGSPEPHAPSSRRGGAILLGGLAVVVVVAVALIVGLGGGSSPSSATTSTAPNASSGSGGSTPPTTSTSASSASGKSTESAKSSGSGKAGKSASEPKLTATLPLTPANSASKALGLVEVIAEGSEHAFIMAAEHLPPTSGFHYAAWLYNTPTDAYFLGGGTTVGSNGTLKAAQGLPANAARYATIILTEEHSERPKQPGPIVLSGPFKLG